MATMTMIEVMQSAGDRVTGGESAKEAAKWWREAGVTPAQADAYIEAGCWDADRVRALIDAGISADAIADEDVEREVERHVRGGGGSLETDGLAYAHSNGDVSTRDIVRAIKALAER